jgi:hypothetical protein
VKGVLCHMCTRRPVRSPSTPGPPKPYREDWSSESPSRQRLTADTDGTFGALTCGRMSARARPLACTACLSAITFLCRTFADGLDSTLALKSRLRGGAAVRTQLRHRLHAAP